MGLTDSRCGVTRNDRVRSLGTHHGETGRCSGIARVAGRYSPVQRAVQCPGCGESIEVPGDGYPPVIVRRRETDDGHLAVAIRVGTIDVHGCIQVSGGRWVQSQDH
jgi:hypothetical protein